MARNKKDSKNRTIAGRPLTPHLLLQLGALRNLPPTPHSFKPEANWLSTYHIWTCHGYVHDGNKNVGYLRIERRRDAASGGWKLAIDQEILHDRANLQQLSARVT